jgi:hypothetical protein
MEREMPATVGFGLMIRQERRLKPELKQGIIVSADESG